MSDTTNDAPVRSVLTKRDYIKRDFGFNCVTVSKDYNRSYMRMYNQTCIDCECGRRITQTKYTKHLTTNYHKKRT